MSTSPHRSERRYIISAHPYLFDVFFRALRWCGSGRVAIQDIEGGVNNARAIVEANSEGYLALKAAGFVVQQFRQKRHRAAAAPR